MREAYRQPVAGQYGHLQGERSHISHGARDAHPPGLAVQHQLTATPLGSNHSRLLMPTPSDIQNNILSLEKRAQKFKCCVHWEFDPRKAGVRETRSERGKENKHQESIRRALCVSQHSPLLQVLLRATARSCCVSKQARGGRKTSFYAVFLSLATGHQFPSLSGLHHLGLQMSPMKVISR